MSNCVYHPIYRHCQRCGEEMNRGETRECSAPPDEPEGPRISALREVRELIKDNAVSTWKSGQIERSDGLTDLLVEFDRRFPEGRE